MMKKGLTIVAGTVAMISILVVSTVETAATSVSSVLPAAGVSLALEEGSPLQEVQQAIDPAVAEKTAQSAKAMESAPAAEDPLESENLQALMTVKMNKVAQEQVTIDENGEITVVAAGEQVATTDDGTAINESVSNETSEAASEGDSTVDDTESTQLEITNAIIADLTGKKVNTDLIIPAAPSGGSTVKSLESAVKAQAEETAEANEEEYFAGLCIAKVNGYVNVRDLPSEEGDVVGKLYDKSVGELIGEKDGWYKITSGNVTGYVKAEYCVTGEAAVELAKEVGTRLAVVTTTTLKVRENPSIDATVLGLVPVDEELYVTEELDGWVQVAIEEGDGYVSTEYVTLKTTFVQAESKAEEEARLAREEEERKAAQAAAAAATAAQNSRSNKNNNNKNNGNKNSGSTAPSVSISGGSSSGNAVASYACQFVGNPYVYGGSSLTNGADCSGFVMSVYRNFGVSLPHSSTADRSVGYAVEGGLANAQPGDLICYSGHVAIYIGGGQIVHASSAKTGIKISNAGYRNPVAVRRIF